MKTYKISNVLFNYNKSNNEVSMKSNTNSNVSNSNNNSMEVSMQTLQFCLLSNKAVITLTEQDARECAQAHLSRAWLAVNADLLKEEGLEEITESHYSFDEAEAIRQNFYDAPSMRRTKRKSVEVEPEVEDEATQTLATYYDDAEEANEADEDIYDMGGAEFYVAKQHKAAIQCGDFDRITKRSSAYEDGGDIGLTRVTGIEHGNDTVFANRVQEEAMLAREYALSKVYAAELKQRFDARRAKEVEMRDFAIAEYKRIAALIVDAESAVKYGEGTYILVRAALKEKFESEYIYKYCRFEFKGKKYPTFETCFHMSMHEKHIKPAVAAVVGDKKKAAYDQLKKLVDSIPGNNANHVARLITSSYKEIGIDRSKIHDALGYAYSTGNFFAGPIYGALKAIAA